MFKWLEKLFWTKCHYCQEKKENYYWLWETDFYCEDIVYSSEELEICTDCVDKFMNNEDSIQ